MNCPFCFTPLEKSDIVIGQNFPCKHCHKWLKARNSGRVRFFRWAGAFAGVGVFVFSMLEGHRSLRMYGSLALILLPLFELFLRQQHPDSEIEPAEPGGLIRY